MGDSKYCYPDSDVLINKLGLTDKDELFLAEMKLTSARKVRLLWNPHPSTLYSYHSSPIFRNPTA